jgi:hypothetical protein
VAYEGTALSSLMEKTQWVVKFGPKLPENKEKAVTELLAMAQAEPPVVPMSYVRDRLRRLGYDDMPTEEEIVKQLAEQQGEQDARVNAELDAGGDTE